MIEKGEVINKLKIILKLIKGNISPKDKVIMIHKRINKIIKQLEDTGK